MRTVRPREAFTTSTGVTYESGNSNLNWNSTNQSIKKSRQVNISQEVQNIKSIDLKPEK